MSPNNQKLLRLLEDILLIDDTQYRDEFGPDEIETWDSLAMVSIAAAVEKEFGYAMTPEEMVSMGTIGDIKSVLRGQGVGFE
ncbi:MAG: acyl carrier protein [Candidatus Zixiibacteriota bacterium]